MQFRLSTFLLLFVLLWSSLAIFGPYGIIISVLVVSASICWVNTRMIAFSICSFLLVMLAILLPVISAVRKTASRNNCATAIQMVGLAVKNYEESLHSLPPSHISDSTGRPMYSWRVTVFPYFCDEIAGYDLNQPWDEPRNRRAAEPYTCFACPTNHNAHPPNAPAFANYLAVVGADTIWSSKTPLRLADLASLIRTILLVEVTDSQIPWTAPGDFDVDSPNRPAITPAHAFDNDSFWWTTNGGTHVMTADMRVHFVPCELLDAKKHPETYRIGGFHPEDVEAAWAASPRRINWHNCISLTVWLAAVGALFYRAIGAERNARRDRHNTTPDVTTEEPSQTETERQE